MFGFAVRRVIWFAGPALFLFPALGQDARPAALETIRAEESANSQIADIAYHLTDLYGPRLTNSPQFRRSADWVVQRLKDWGLGNVHFEKWATPPDRPLPSWECTYFNAAMAAPSYQPLIAVPDAWSPPTGGVLTGEAMLFQVPRSMTELEKVRGRQAGKMVLIGSPSAASQPPPAEISHRYTDAELARLASALIPPKNPFTRPAEPDLPGGLMAAIGDWLSHDQPLAIVRNGGENEEGPAYQGGIVHGPGFINASTTYSWPVAILAAEQFNRIARLLEHGVPVQLQLEIKTAVDDTYKKESLNVIAEIPGAAKPEEVVMAGAHLDSWPYATGATDDAIGCTAAMEAMRILRRSHLPMDRTVRLALWGGEEQGMLGSMAYVKQHFADRADMRLKPEHEKFSVYFNLDGGTGKIRGIYLRNNEKARPVFEAWFRPLKDLDVTTVAPRDVEGGIMDHFSFDEVGLPAFQFLQDPLDFQTRTLHTNMDTFDRIQLPDAKQMAVVLASLLYDAATYPGQMPRKELPGAKGN